MIQLRPHQIHLDADIDAAKKAGHRNVLAVSPTGSGKTVLFSHRTKKRHGNSAIIAHRGELLGQISFTLSRFHVPHRIIAPPAVIREINRAQLTKLKRTSYDPNARCSVVSIQSLAANLDRFKNWGTSVTDWINDEGHHVLADNIWGKGLNVFPNAQGELYTAHSGRGDGKGLGRHAQGLADVLVEGPQMRDLINAGFLVDYKIYCPPSDFKRENLSGIGAQGEFLASEVKAETRRSHILGDVVESYIKIAMGKKGITFASDIEDATDIALRFNLMGVPAAAVSSKTPMADRIKFLNQFENGQLLQLVNVDLFGEGYDLPALEVVSFARPTASFQTYLQQFGRVLRICEGKFFGIVIDHVGNVIAHGLPDAHREQTLDARPRSSKTTKDPDVIPLKKCLNPDCWRPYEAIHPSCPYCGYKPAIAERSRIEHVEGDLYELDPETLRMMRGQVDKHLAYPNVHHLSPIIAASVRKKHWEKCQTLELLKESMAWWAGWQENKGLTMQQSYRAFYYRFGVDVVSAQMLDRKDAEELHNKIQDHIKQMSGGIDKSVNSK